MTTQEIIQLAPDTVSLFELIDDQLSIDDTIKDESINWLKNKEVCRV